MKKSLALLIGLTVLQLTLGYVCLDHLPERVATQFDQDGKAVSYMSRDNHFFFVSFLAITLNLVFFGLPCLIEKYHSFRWINLPWKRYWTASIEKKTEAMHKLIQTLYRGGYLINIIIAAATLVIVNENSDIALPISLKGFLLFTGTSIFLYSVWLILVFKPR